MKQTLAMETFLEKVDLLRQKIHHCVVGQNELVESLLIALLEGGHLLVEGVPGVAKTLTVKCFAALIDAHFQRIQFTPDLLPADLIGTEIFRQQHGEFIARKGPVFTQILLADEINRAPAKVQSALLEAMQERQVTIGSVTYPLPEPFFVMATQNPIEEEGTYQLPAAQLDRFTMKVQVDYPAAEEELEILTRIGKQAPPLPSSLLPIDQLQHLRAMVAQVQVAAEVQQYIVNIAQASRPENHQRHHYMDFVRFLEHGVSPRASLALYRCACIVALLANRSYVLPEDVKKITPRVMRHRLILSYEAEAEGLSPDDVIGHILNSVALP